MKHLKIIALVCILALVSTDSFGKKRHHRYKNKNKAKTTQTTKHNTGDAVGAPLDGGLLSILGAAGVAYYVARKKKKKSLEL